MEDQPSKSKKALKVSLVILLVFAHVFFIQIGLLILFLVQYDAIQSIFNEFLSWIEDRPLGGMALIMFAYIVGITIMIPTSLFILTIGIVCNSLMGAVGGFFVALFLVLFCTEVGCSIAFIISRSLLKKTILSAIKPNWIKTRAILRALETKGFKLVLLFRLAPIFPFSLLNYALGASSVTFLDYTYGNIGLVPKQAFYIYIAISVGSVSEALKKEQSNYTELIIILSIGALLSIIAAVYLTIIAKKEIKKILDETQPILGNSEEILND